MAAARPHASGRRRLSRAMNQAVRRLSRSCSSVGDPASPSGVSYTRHVSPRAFPAPANGSRPLMRTVGEPMNWRRSASSAVSTCSRMGSTSAIPCSRRTSRSRAFALAREASEWSGPGSSSATSSVTRMTRLSIAGLRAECRRLGMVRVSAVLKTHPTSTLVDSNGSASEKRGGRHGCSLTDVGR